MHAQNEVFHVLIREYLSDTTLMDTYLGDESHMSHVRGEDCHVLVMDYVNLQSNLEDRRLPLQKKIVPGMETLRL